MVSDARATHHLVQVLTFAPLSVAPLPVQALGFALRLRLGKSQVCVCSENPSGPPRSATDGNPYVPNSSESP